MVARPPPAEAEVERIRWRLEKLELRLAALEEAIYQRSSGANTGDTGEQAQLPGPAIESTEDQAARTAALIGRTLLILGGGYLIRALTEATLVGRMTGISLGLVYAVSWLLAADRAGNKCLRTSATFFGISTCALAFPLLWESTSLASDLALGVSTALLTMTTAAVLALAWFRNLPVLAWAATAGAATTSFAMGLATRSLELPIAALIILGALAVLSAETRNWHGIRWLAAATAVAGTTILGLGALVERSNVKPSFAIGTQLALLILFTPLLILGWRRSGRRIGLFTAVQATLVVIVGYGGAAFTAAQELQTVSTTLGVAGVLTGCLTAAAALRTQTTDPGTVQLTSAAAATFVVIGSALLPLSPALLWAPLGLALAAYGSFAQRPTCSLFGVLFSVLACLESGLVLRAGYALFAPGANSWPPLSTAALASLISLLGCSWVPMQASATWPFWARASTRLVALALGLFSVGGTVIVPLIRVSGTHVDDAALAVLRTAVLAVLALAAALMSRWTRFFPISWLVYPTLLLGGFKLVFEDYPRGRASTLVLSLILYGSALLATARIARHTPRSN